MISRSAESSGLREVGLDGLQAQEENPDGHLITGSLPGTVLAPILVVMNTSSRRIRRCELRGDHVLVEVVKAVLDAATRCPRPRSKP